MRLEALLTVYSIRIILDAPILVTLMLVEDWVRMPGGGGMKGSWINQREEEEVVGGRG